MNTSHAVEEATMPGETKEDLKTLLQIHATLSSKHMTGEAFALLAEYSMFPELYFSSRMSITSAKIFWLFSAADR
jgi:hypothetical protein